MNVKCEELVLINKKTSNLVVVLKDTWFGDVINYGYWPEDKVITEDAPFIFDDDERFDLNEYEVLGKL